MSRKLSKQALELIKKYGLVDDPNDPDNSDVFHSNRFSIITRGGIDKISSKANIDSSLEVVYSTPYEVVIKGVYSNGDRTISTLGESTVDEYVVNKVTSSKFSRGALGLIKDAALSIKNGSNEDGEQLEDDVIDRLKSVLSSISTIRGVESEEEVIKTLIKKGNVTSTNSKGDPIPNYRWAMAEKRANSRGVLKLVGLYDEGFFGEEEADDFKAIVGKASKSSDNKKAGASSVKVDSIDIE